MKNNKKTQLECSRESEQRASHCAALARKRVSVTRASEGELNGVKRIKMNSNNLSMILAEVSGGLMWARALLIWPNQFVFSVSYPSSVPEGKSEAATSGVFVPL